MVILPIKYNERMLHIWKERGKKERKKKPSNESFRLLIIDLCTETKESERGNFSFFILSKVVCIINHYLFYLLLLDLFAIVLVHQVKAKEFSFLSDTSDLRYLNKTKRKSTVVHAISTPCLLACGVVIFRVTNDIYSE